MAISPPNYQKDAIPTPQGWRHPRSGELLVCMKISKEAINEHLGVSPEPQMLKESPTNFQEAKTELLTQSVDWDLKSMTKLESLINRFMLRFKELTEKNLFLYAAKHYKNPKFSDIDDFYEDLKRFKYIKRLLNRYIESDDLAERLLLNHFIVVFNMFGVEAALNILELKLERKHWPVVKPFLIFLNYIRNDQYTGIVMDPLVVEQLRKI